MDIIKQLLMRGSWVVVGASMLWLANNLFDWALYPIVMCTLGTWHGALLMTIISVPFNYALIKGYDLIGEDLFALEALKAYQHQHDKPSVFRKLLAKSKWFTFVSMSLWDPIPAVIYIRNGNHAFAGLNRSDWKLFGLATIIANGTWIGLMITGFAAVGAVEEELYTFLSFFGLESYITYIGACR